MKADVEKKINARTAAAFEDMVSGMSSKARNGILTAAEELVKTVWLGKIYAAMPADKTTVAEYFLDQELEQFLNEAVEECHKKIEAIVENVKRQ
jgi:predicted DNA-binding transcriptional regulator